MAFSLMWREGAVNGGRATVIAAEAAIQERPRQVWVVVSFRAQRGT